MPRQAAIWKRKQDGYFYVTLKGKKVRLSKDKKEAQQAFHALMSKERDPLEKAGLSPTFKRLADLFLDEAEKTKAPGTYAVQLNYLQLFSDFIGTKRAAEVKVHHVTEWLHSHDSWSESTRTTARSILRACMNWGVQQGYLKEHPLSRLKRGEFTRRERVMSADERAKLLTILEELGTLHVGGPKLENVESVIDKIEALYRPSFSAIIKKQSVEFKCSECGFGGRKIYRIDLRRALIPALVYMAHNPNKAWNMSELFDVLVLDSLTAAKAARGYGTELRHFGLIEKVPGNHYRVTQLGIDFVNGEARVPEWVWPDEPGLPESCKNGPLVSAEEIRPVDHSDKVMHASNAVSASSDVCA